MNIYRGLPPFPANKDEISLLSNLNLKTSCRQPICGIMQKVQGLIPHSKNLVSRAVGLGNTFREKLTYFQLSGEGRRGDGVHCVADLLSE